MEIFDDQLCYPAVGAIPGRLWIQHEPDFRVIVLFTRDGEATIRQYVQNTPLEAVVVVRTVDASLAEVKSELFQVMQMIQQLDISFSTGIDVQANRGNLYVLDEGEVLAYFQQINLTLPEHTVIVEVNELETEVNE